MTCIVKLGPTVFEEPLILEYLRYDLSSCCQFHLGTLAFTSAKPPTSALFGSGGKSWRKVQEEELF